MGKTFKEISWKSKDFQKVKDSRKTKKHAKLEPYNRSKSYEK